MLLLQTGDSLLLQDGASVLLLDEPGAPTGFAFVRHSDNAFGTAGSSPVTFAPAAITAGNLVVVSVGAGYGVSSIDGVTDSLGNTYTPVAASQLWHQGGAAYERTFYTVATAGGASPTVSATFTGTADAYRGVSVAEYTVPGPVTLAGEAHAGITTNAASPANSGPITTPTDALLYGYGDWAAVVLAAPTGWTARNPTNGTTFDFLNQPPGTYAFQPTYTGSQTWFAQIVAFREAPLGGGRRALTLLGVG